MKNYTNKFKKNSDQPFLLVKGITVNFGGLQALNRVDLEVKEEGIRGTIGPNGAGKTTLFNTITGYIKADAGEVKYKGTSILGLQPHDIAKKGIVRTFQKSAIFSEMSVLENLMTGYHRLSATGLLGISFRSKMAKSEENKIKMKALEVLESIKLFDLVEHVAGDLSYGEQRLVEIGRALMSSPKLLLLDEPAAGLSSLERDHLVQLLKRISDEQSISILLTDHSMDFVMEICNYITVLNFGQKIAEGTPKEIQQNEEVIKAYLGKGEE